MQNLHEFFRAAEPEQLIDALGGEHLDGSGFENEDPEGAFGEAEE